MDHTTRKKLSLLINFFLTFINAGLCLYGYDPVFCYKQSDILKNENYKLIITDNSKITEWLIVIKYITYVQVRQLDFKTNL